MTVNDPGTRRGFWIRYTTLQPLPNSQTEAHVALWAFAFDHDDPVSNWGGRQTFPPNAFRSERNPFRLRLGDAVMNQDGCEGEVRSDHGSARWRLRWESREVPFPFIDPRFQGLSTVANIGAQPALTISGTIDVAGRSHRLDRAPGGQQHTWGTSHALAWNWGFASGQDFWVDGATSRVRSRLGRVLRGTALGARIGTELFRSNGLLRVLRNPGTISPDGWTAQARLGDRRLEVSVRPRRPDLIGVTYDDPRGGKRYCYHTEVADLTLRLRLRDQAPIEVKRLAAAAFEYASEDPLPGVALAV